MILMLGYLDKKEFLVCYMYSSSFWWFFVLLIVIRSAIFSFIPSNAATVGTPVVSSISFTS